MNKRRKRRVVSTHDDAPAGNVLLVIALPEERSYFHGVVSARSGWDAPIERRCYKCTYHSPFGPVKVTVQTLDGMGQIEAVLGTTSAIVSSGPDLAVMLGISGSLDPQVVGLGDVVVSNQVKMYSRDKVASLVTPDGNDAGFVICSSGAKISKEDGKILIDSRDKFLSHSFFRYERKIVTSRWVDPILSDAEHALEQQTLKQLDVRMLPAQFQALASSVRARKVHMGWILGSHTVVDSKEYRSYLVDKNKDLSLDVHKQKGEHGRVSWDDGELLAVDMESYGLLRSVEMMRATPSYEGGCGALIGGIAVRGISDLCEEKGRMDAATGKLIRRLAVENATAVCLKLIETLDYGKLRRV